MESRVWKLREVAQLFSVKEVTIRHWCNNEGLGSFRTIGGHRRFKSEHLEAFMVSKGFDEKNLDPKALRGEF